MSVKWDCVSNTPTFRVGVGGAGRIIVVGRSLYRAGLGYCWSNLQKWISLGKFGRVRLFWIYKENSIEIRQDSGILTGIRESGLVTDVQGTSASRLEMVGNQGFYFFLNN